MIETERDPGAACVEATHVHRPRRHGSGLAVSELAGEPLPPALRGAAPRDDARVIAAGGNGDDRLGERDRTRGRAVFRRAVAELAEVVAPPAADEAVAIRHCARVI